MKVFVAGASGATGRHLVDQLLKQGHEVVAVVRTPENLPEFLKNRKGLTIHKAALLDLSDPQLAELIKGCDAIASCLGHNLTWKGIYGHPRRLVTDAVRRLSQLAVQENPKKPVKMVLMNTTGNRNRDLKEPISMAQHLVLALLRLLLPPHVDNEKAADYLRKEIGQNHPGLEWVVVRPSSLIDEDQVSEYENHPSPTRSAIFNDGKTSRINVAHFMSKLITDDELWTSWKGQMPVIYKTEIEK